MTRKATNPMKEDKNGVNDAIVSINNVKYESQDAADYATATTNEYAVQFEEGKGTGKDGVYTVADIDSAIEGVTAQRSAQVEDGENQAITENQAKTDTVASDVNPTVTETTEAQAVKFASDAAEKLAKDSNVDLSGVKATGKSGFTKADIEQAIAATGNDDEAQATESRDDVKSIIEDLVSFGLPVKGALKDKPKVQATWLDLQNRAQKALQAL